MNKRMTVVINKVITHWEIIQYKMLRQLKQGANRDVPTKLLWGPQDRGLQRPRRSESLAQPCHNECLPPVLWQLLPAATHSLAAGRSQRQTLLRWLRTAEVISAAHWPSMEQKQQWGHGPSPQVWAQHGGHERPLPGAPEEVLRAQRPLPGSNSHPWPRLQP